MEPKDLSRRVSALPQQSLRQQSSATYHPSITLNNPNPFISGTRPRVDSPSTRSDHPQVKIADRVRSISTSSLVTTPSAAHNLDPKKMESMDGQSRKVNTLNEPAVEGGIQRGKNMFSWFQDTVVISMLVRNWPN